MTKLALPMMTLPGWVEAAKTCGFELEPLLADAGITLDLLRLESTPVDVRKMQALMLACVRATRRGHFPFALGQAFGLAYLPELQTLLRSAPTLREAVHVFEWVRRLINPRVAVRIEEDDALAWLIFELVGAEGELAMYFTEAMLAAVISAGSALLGDNAWCVRVWLRHPAPAHRDQYPARAQFAREVNALATPRALFDQPLPGAWPALHNQAHLRLQERYPEGARSSGLAARIERLYAAESELVAQELAPVAERLRLHPRTMQRRLKQEGQSFADLRARARMQLACAWLREELAIEDIASRLGFADRRAFTRAFTAWVGLSPSAYRDKR